MRSIKEAPSGQVEKSHTQRALDEVYRDSEHGVLTDRQFSALGMLAAVALVSNEFDSIAELRDHIRDRAVRGSYSESDSARLMGIGDVLERGVQFTPSKISISEYQTMKKATGEFHEGRIDEDLYKLGGLRGLVALRRIGNFWSAEITPRGRQAMEILESKPSI